MPEFIHVNSEETLKKLNSNKQDKLVKYYMDGCSHCDDLEPIWKLVESRIKKDHDDSNIIIVQLNANFMENADMPNVEGFPTIRMIKGGRKIEHKGARTEEAIMDFFQKNSLLTTQSGGGRHRRKTKKKPKRSRKNKRRAKRKGGSLIGVGAYEYQQEQQAIENGTALYIPGQKLFYANQYNEYKAFLNDPGYTSGETKEEPEVGVVLTKQLVRSYFDNLIGKSIYLVKNGTEPSNRWKIKVLKLAMPKERVSWLEKDLNIKYSQSDGGIIKYLTQVAAPEATGGGKRRTRRKSKKNKRKSKKYKRKSKHKRSKKGKGPVMSKVKGLMPAKKVKPQTAIIGSVKVSDDNYEEARLNRRGHELANEIRNPRSPWTQAAAEQEFDQNKRIYERKFKNVPVAEVVEENPETLGTRPVSNIYYNPKTNDGRDDNFVVVSSRRRRRGRNTNRVVPITGGKRKKTKSRKKARKWSKKYKKSINCKKPKGFSQKQYCKYGRKKK